jgi:CRISPR system Cascade subunit CasB
MTTTGLPTAAPSGSAERRPISQIVNEAADTHIKRLQSGYTNDHPAAVAALARIRRGAGKPIHAVPDLWGLSGTELLYREIDERRQAEEFTRAENAVHIAVTLWALHQQSQKGSPMHLSGGPQLGRAVRDIMPGDEIDEPLRRRFVRAGTATSLDGLTQRLRDIVLVLRQNAQPMDYGALAAQLYQWQRPDQRLAVHRAWGRNFHARSQRPAAASTTSVTEPKESS